VIPFRHDTTIGLLSVHYLRPAALSAYAENFAVVADVIATALERARARDALTTQLRDLEAAYAERDRIARTLSGTFVPPTLPDLPGFDATGWVEPAADGIAGDFYDLFQIAGGDWVAVLGDVAGKGAEAGAVTALARYAARASALSDPDPAAIAEIANRTLYEDSSDLFCTIGLVRYAAAEQTIDVTLAGHPQARLLYEGRVERLGHPNLALGIELTNYQTSRYPLPAGATVVLFSDGLTDRAHSFSDDDLDDFLATVESDCAAKVADNLRSLVHRLPADHPDDVAVLAVSRLR
jgi:sigma-B regulation protein RsbU (phosphoserine phosphatase)